MAKSIKIVNVEKLKTDLMDLCSDVYHDGFEAGVKKKPAAEHDVKRNLKKAIYEIVKDAEV